MPVENDFLPFAAEPGANVVAQGTYNGSGFQETGQQPGIGLSAYFNKVWRQGSLGMAVIAAFIVAILDEAVLDSGYSSGADEVAALETQFQNAIATFTGAAAAPAVIPVTWSITPACDFAAGNLVNVVFEITLSGNTAPIFSNIVPGALVTFIIHQDGTGGHTWTWPGSSVIDGGAIDPAPGATSVQSFVVNGVSVLNPIGGIVG